MSEQAAPNTAPEIAPNTAPGHTPEPARSEVAASAAGAPAPARAWEQFTQAASAETDGPTQAGLFEQAADALAAHLAGTGHE